MFKSDTWLNLLLLSDAVTSVTLTLKNGAEISKIQDGEYISPTVWKHAQGRKCVYFVFHNSLMHKVISAGILKQEFNM